MAKFNSVFREEISIHLSVREAELSHEAYRHYKRTMVLFDEFLCKINHADKEISESVVELWIREVSADISINTSVQHIHYIRQLLLFLTALGYTCFIPRTLATRDTYVPYLYSDEDVEKIFAATDSLRVSKARKNKFAEKEMPLILRLLYCCGLRVGETVCIKVGDLDFERNLIVLRVTKKYKQRLIPFEEDLAEIIYRYCIGMGILNDSDAYLFPADDVNSHISSSSVGNYFRIIRENAGIRCKNQTEHGRSACLHCFRHSFAVRSFDKNERSGIKASESVPFLSTYLGHDSLYETEKYLKYSGTYFEDTLTKFDDYSGELFPEVIIYE
ncbi:MAG: tyrosine-type recombinase/integrase [Lachnospiraceae bacterium]|nr:tyrosine-type recombinase/integrase [Lachnospiraceae bacterium]